MRLADLWEIGSRGKSCRKARRGGRDIWVLWWLSGKECPWKDGQPYCTLQRPELGNHVRETVLLKIQNSRVFIKPASLKAGMGGGGEAQRTNPSSQEKRVRNDPWIPNERRQENQTLKSSSLWRWHTTANDTKVSFPLPRIGTDPSLENKWRHSSVSVIWTATTEDQHKTQRANPKKRAREETLSTAGQWSSTWILWGRKTPWEEEEWTWLSPGACHFP